MTVGDGPGAELVSNRIFLDEHVARAAMAVDANAAGVLGYFASEIRAGVRATPDAIVAAVDGLAPPIEKQS